MADEQDISQKLNDIITPILDQYGQSQVQKIKDGILSADKLATGELYNSIDYAIAVDENSVAVQIEAADYFKYVDLGRGQGKDQPPMQAILAWIQSRRINPDQINRRNKLGRFSKGFKLLQNRKSNGQFAAGTLLQRQTKVAWAIAKSIAMRGIKGLGLTQEEQVAQTQITNDLSTALSLSLDEIVSNEFLQSMLSVTSKNIKTQIK